jgi:hypothetical protein
VSARSRDPRRHLAAFADLGPLRPVAVATAVLPTAGLLLTLAALPSLAVAWPAGASGALLATAAIAAAVAAVLLPPSFAAFAAGYVLGPAGIGAAAVGSALAAVLGQRLVWPLLGERLYAFMRGRPRAIAAQRFCQGGLAACSVRVAAFRLAVRLPFAVQSLLLSVANTAVAPVALGSLLAALPVAALAGGLGAAARRWSEVGALPTPTGAGLLGTAMLLVGALAVAARTTWRRAGG